MALSDTEQRVRSRLSSRAGEARNDAQAELRLVERQGRFATAARVPPDLRRVLVHARQGRPASNRDRSAARQDA